MSDSQLNKAFCQIEVDIKAKMPAICKLREGSDEEDFTREGKQGPLRKLSGNQKIGNDVAFLVVCELKDALLH